MLSIEEKVKDLENTGTQWNKADVYLLKEFSIDIERVSNREFNHQTHYCHHWLCFENEKL